MSISLKISLIAGALLLAGTLEPRQAHACSYAVVVMESTYPKAGAVDVPTNAVLFVYGPELTSADDIELVNAKGEAVPVEVRAVSPSGMDLIPLNELQPEHKYQLRTTGSLQLATMEFTTGKEAAEVPPQLQAPDLHVALLTFGNGTCGDVTGICVEAAHPADTTLEVRIGDEVLSPKIGADRAQFRAYGQALADEDCVEVRVRDVRGNRSEPSLACDERLQRIYLSDFSTNTDYVCDYEGVAETSSSPPDQDAAPPEVSTTESQSEPESVELTQTPSNCAVAHSGPVRGNHSPLIFGVAALLLARRRRTI